MELGSVTVLLEKHWALKPTLLILLFASVAPPADMDVRPIHYELWGNPSELPVGFAH